MFRSNISDDFDYDQTHFEFVFHWYRAILLLLCVLGVAREDIITHLGSRTELGVPSLGPSNQYLANE